MKLRWGSNGALHQSLCLQMGLGTVAGCRHEPLRVLLSSELTGWLRGLIRYIEVGKTAAHMSPDGEIRGELVLCRRAGSPALASVEKMFVRLKPSPLGRAPGDLPSCRPLFRVVPAGSGRGLPSPAEELHDSFQKPAWKKQRRRAEAVNERRSPARMGI